MGVAAVIDFVERGLVRRRFVAGIAGEDGFLKYREAAMPSRTGVDVAKSDDKRLVVLVEMGPEGIDTIPADFSVSYDAPADACFKMSWRLVDRLGEGREVAAGHIPMQWTGSRWEGRLAGIPVPRGEPRMVISVVPEFPRSS